MMKFRTPLKKGWGFETGVLVAGGCCPVLGTPGWDRPLYRIPPRNELMVRGVQP